MASTQGKGQETMVFRFILYSVIAYLVIGFIKKLIGAAGEKQRAAARQRRPGKSRSAALMVRCAACGTFIEESRAILAGGSDFCSTACAHRAAQRA